MAEASTVEVPVVLVDTLAAAEAVQCATGTIRSWASRGKLESKGRDSRGRTLYELAEVYAVASGRAGGEVVVEAMARILNNEGAWCGLCEYAGWDSCGECRVTCMGYARALVAAGYGAVV